MNWINNLSLPKINDFFQRREMPENLWRKCENCEQMIFHRELKQNLYVCPHCDHHMRIGPIERLESLYDYGSYTLVDVDEPVADPLNFRDEKRYTDRLREARRNTGEKEGDGRRPWPDRRCGRRLGRTELWLHGRLHGHGGGRFAAQGR